jgi:hypothetical protein
MDDIRPGGYGNARHKPPYPLGWELPDVTPAVPRRKGAKGVNLGVRRVVRAWRIQNA